MKNIYTVLPTFGVLAVCFAFVYSPALAQEASTGRYVITNNDVYRAPNSASIFQLSGSKLTSLPAAQTTGWGIGTGFFGTNLQTAVQVGSNVCLYVSDPGSDDIAAFNSTNFASVTSVGNYVDFSGSGAYSGIGLAAHGTTLYAGYSASVNLGIWAIHPDCSLSLGSAASNHPTKAPINNLAVSPNGKTLILTYGLTTPGVDAYAISGSSLVEKGSVNTLGYTAGIDFTQDSKYVLLGDYNGSFTEVEIFPVNTDSSLGAEDYYYIPQGGADSNEVWLSPDQTVVYVSNNVSFQITTLTFSERAGPGHRLSFACISAPLRVPAGGTLYGTAGIATGTSSGKGGNLYVAEWGSPSAIGLMQIPANGCPVEVSGSPVLNPAGAFPATLIAYPPRPF